MFKIDVKLHQINTIMFSQHLRVIAYARIWHKRIGHLMVSNARIWHKRIGNLNMQRLVMQT